MYHFNKRPWPNLQRATAPFYMEWAQKCRILNDILFILSKKWLILQQFTKSCSIVERLLSSCLQGCVTPPSGGQVTNTRKSRNELIIKHVFILSILLNYVLPCFYQIQYVKLQFLLMRKHYYKFFCWFFLGGWNGLMLFPFMPTKTDDLSSGKSFELQAW